jgi:hypothetical protein
VASFCFAIGFAIFAIILNKVRKSANPLNRQTIFLDLLRGASIFLLMLFSLSALTPQMGKFALTGGQVLISLSSANGLFAIISDLWRNI